MSLFPVIPQGLLRVKRKKTIAPIIVWLGFDPFRPVQNHIGSGAGNPTHRYVRFGPRRWPSDLAHSQWLYGGDWSLCVDGACIIAFSAQSAGL